MTGKKKTLNAYRAVLSWLHRNKVQPGDFIPPQLELGQELGFCQGTLSAAMRILVEDEVLSRKQKTGTIVKNLMPQNPNRRIWVAGIVMPELIGSGFVATLTMHLHRELANRNFSDRTYFVSPQSAPASEVDMREPSDFLGLESDIETGLVDGLITSTRLLCDVLPCVTLSESPNTNLRVVHDDSYFFKSAAHELRGIGCKRIFVLSNKTSDIELARQIVGRFIPAVDLVSLPIPCVERWAIDAAADRYIASAGQSDLSGLIIPDDYAASVFSHRVALASDLRPTICLRTYEESLLYFSLPTLKFLSDLSFWSSAAVDLLIARLLGTSEGNVEMRFPSPLRHAKPEDVWRSPRKN